MLLSVTSLCNRLLERQYGNLAKSDKTVLPLQPLYDDPIYHSMCRIFNNKEGCYQEEEEL
jgi:hypothetical protein